MPNSIHKENDTILKEEGEVNKDDSEEE